MKLVQITLKCKYYPLKIIDKCVDIKLSDHDSFLEQPSSCTLKINRL